jgi:hypothetical protein
LTNSGGEVTREVRETRVELFLADDRRVAEATGGTELVGFGQVVEENHTKGAGMKHGSC